ncbi:MAG: hypothetical protein ABII12_15150 [Planctomycetota bacterium]
MVRTRWLGLPILAAAFSAALFIGGCISVKAPEEINVGSQRRRPADTSRVPHTSSHEEARQKLAEAYEEIRHLENKARDLENDKRKCKRERDEYKDKYEHLRDRYDD